MCPLARGKNLPRPNFTCIRNRYRKACVSTSFSIFKQHNIKRETNIDKRMDLNCILSWVISDCSFTKRQRVRETRILYFTDVHPQKHEKKLFRKQRGDFPLISPAPIINFFHESKQLNAKKNNNNDNLMQYDK